MQKAMLCIRYRLVTVLWMVLAMVGEQSYLLKEPMALNQNVPGSEQIGCLGRYVSPPSQTT